MGGEVPDPRRLHRALSVPEEALHLVFGYVDDPRDREAASLVCRRWHRIDALTRKHVTVRFCYAAEPARLRARFPRLESLAIKGRPRAAMYGLIPEDWGAYAAPWLTELAEPLDCLKAVHLRRMTVTDDDIAELVRARGHMLQVLKLDKCSGFSTDALRLVARSCRYDEQPIPESPCSGHLQQCYFLLLRSLSLSCLSLIYAGKQGKWGVSWIVAQLSVCPLREITIDSVEMFLNGVMGFYELRSSFSYGVLDSTRSNMGKVEPNCSSAASGGFHSPLPPPPQKQATTCSHTLMRPDHL
jgi:hypothetical protein